VTTPEPAWRLAAPAGAFIDRGSPLHFTFEGRRFPAYAGDTVASALAANGVSVLSRSFKYHRPRGIVSLAGCEANTLVDVNGVPNVLAESHRLADGDRVLGQNYWGSLAFDLNSWIGAFGRFFPVGFYYRAFYRPRGAWRFWEPFIRRMAGLGKVDPAAAHGRYDKAHLFAEVAVVGGGAAGLGAALAAAERGGRVIVIDDQPALGGALNYRRYDAAGQRGCQERDALLARLAASSNVTILTEARCEGLFADNWLAVVRGRRLYKLRAREVVLATGALEQPALFRNNDLPGIVYGSAAQKLIRLYGVRPGTRAVVLTANDPGYGVALDLLDAGIEVAAVLDARKEPSGPLHAAVLARSVPVAAGTIISEAAGRRHVRGVVTARLGGAAGVGPPATIACDLVCVSVGLAPDLALAAQAGARLVYDAASGMHRPENLPGRVTVVGRANGGSDRDAGLADVAAAWLLQPHPRGKDFVDFDEDLTVQDIVDTVASGFDDIQLLKRYATAGMGPSQGRHSAVNTIRLAARARGADVAAIGTTTARPPWSGESFGVLAGRRSDPVRHTAMHHRHLEAGAQMMAAGAWMRPAYYGGRSRADAAIAGEVAAVRTAAGLIDVSTLGKIEVRGPDAAEFLDRLYATGHRRQPVGRARYALMTDAAGAVTDDGVICRLGETHFFVTATTSGVEAVVRAMYFWNAHWRLDIDVSHVSAAYAAVNLAGPASRAILTDVCRDVDLAPASFPYMGVRNGHVTDVPARILRVGFVGEVGFEIHVPSGCGEFVWDRLMEAGAPLGLRPFGVEAQRVLRLEKGHIIIGQDTDGLTNLMEIGMAPGSGKPFFVGAAALAAHCQRGIARKLVGFTIDSDAAVPKECHLVIEGGEIAGRVTSCVRSATAGRVIGLAYVRLHQAEPGRSFIIRVDGGRLVQATVAPLPFYDPGNERQKA